MGKRFQEHVADYLLTVAEALSIPPAGTDEGEPVYYQLLEDRLMAVVRTLKIALEDGLSRALPEQTVSLRSRIAELPVTSYQYASEDWAFNPVRPRAQASGEQLHELVTDFLAALLEMLDAPASGGSRSRSWLLEDRVVAANIAMAMVLGSDLDRSLPEEAATLRDRLEVLRKARY
jgi:hypothetical protein